jgi:peptide/nickel transport system permease protein
MSERLRFARTPGGKAGLVLVGAIVLIAVFGPLLAPHTPTETIGPPGSGPSGEALLGTDFLGRDVLTRVLYGGRSLLLLAALATALAYALGVAVGLLAGYTRSWVESALMRLTDVMRVFPPLVFLLVLIAGVGTGSTVLVIGVALVQAPGIARLTYTVTLETSLRGYVEAAAVRGERTVAILRREVLPNILASLIADAGLRFTFSILFIAAVSFLNLGLQPPAADWALMVNENRSMLLLNPWVIAIPAALIAILTIGVNLVGDAVSRSLGKSDLRGATQ